MKFDTICEVSIQRSPLTLDHHIHAHKWSINAPTIFKVDYGGLSGAFWLQIEPWLTLDVRV